LAYLANRYHQGEDWTPVISAYNQGNIRKKGAHYANQAYVNKVLNAWTS
jgi:hypothetical protein